jgi:hypothetical protein
MTTTKATVDQKIDNVQDQLDVMRRENAAFKGYVHRQFTVIAKEMATKDDLRRLEANILAETASKAAIIRLEEGMRQMRIDMATKKDLQTLTVLVIKIAEKVGVSP